MHKPNTNSHLLSVFVEDEHISAADSDSGTLAESGIAAPDKVVDRNIEVWASGCILVVGL